MLLKLDTTKITPYKAGLSDKKACNKQINEGVSLLRKIKKAYYSNLNVKNIVDNVEFWKTVKSFFLF